MLDEDLSEDVDGRQVAQSDGTLTRPNQIDPEDAGQVGRTHLVNDALEGHLKDTTNQRGGFSHMTCCPNTGKETKTVSGNSEPDD